MVARDSMLNNIHERGLSYQHNKKIKNFPGATTKIIWEKLENLIESKLDVVIVHAGTIDLPKNIKTLNNLKYIGNVYSYLLEPSLFFRKDKSYLDKHWKDVNARIKNFWKQKDIDLIDNFNLEKLHVGSKKFHLNNR